MTMTVTTIDGLSLCEQLAENYKRTLPKGRGGTDWTMESFSTWVSLRYPEVRVVEGQEWTGNGAKYKFICEEHGEYEARAGSVLDPKNGSQCKRCNATRVGARFKQRQYAITASFVGQTTTEGHLILEHIGYKAKPSDVAKGKIGAAHYRYKCGVCGNEHATALGRNLKTPGHTTHCGCLSKRDSRNTFSRSEAKANAPCTVYIYYTVNGTGIKVGIARDAKKRETQSYEEQAFVSQQLTRANAWAVEQVLHHRLKSIGLQYDLTDVPAWLTEGNTNHIKDGVVEAGGSEVFHSVSMPWLVAQLIDLMDEADAIGWQALLDRYIPITEMNHLQLFYWDGEHQRQSSGEGYIGHSVRSVFDLQTI